ncbi:STAS domain-containing protein [Streptomyces sp. gb14]|uniref:STAS domain-containing protein n=1 Tax=Streptomyces sp. gb14 TaxID=1827753 RepID=UPI000BF19BDF|nr:STAS domain-containing protein [Streptomyces sp. gb14]
MTTHPEQHLQLTTVDTRHTIRIEIRGDLDYLSTDALVEEATTQLANRPDLTDLHLGCAGLEAIDSMGLSTLLMIHRRTSVAGVRLHLDDRPATLDRLLHLTGTLEYLTS